VREPQFVSVVHRIAHPRSGAGVTGSASTQERDDCRSSRKAVMRSSHECAEEDSNLHPVIPDQALNLVTRVSYPSYASTSSRTFADLDAMDAMDDLDVATDVAAER
jgi:hypothetical protein